MRNHFVFAWAGNKRDEVYDIVPKFDFNNVDTIIEPFCGTSAVSVYIATTHNNKYKYILNDNDERLIEIYNTLKDESELLFLENEMNRIIGDKEFNEEMYYKTIQQDNLIGYMLARTIYYLRIGLFNRSKTRKPKTKVKYINSIIHNFMKTEQVELYNKNAIDIIKDNIDNEKCIIYLDPPYLETRNKDYYKHINNFEDIYTYLSTLKDIKCKIYLSILFNEKLICKLNNFNIIHTYDKVYSWGNKKVKTHILMMYVNTISI
jgi:site-specific DNA-adenine methylase